MKWRRNNSHEKANSSNPRAATKILSGLTLHRQVVLHLSSMGISKRSSKAMPLHRSRERIAWGLSNVAN
jgi:hypothetical protein